MDNSLFLGTEKISTLIRRFYWPSFVSVIVTALYNMIDRIFIGQGIGSAALSGLSIVFPITLIIMAFGMLIGVGTGVQVSISLGERNSQKTEKTLGTGFAMMLLVSLFITAIIYLIKDPLLRSFGATNETIGYAEDYLNVLLPATIFQVVGFSMNNVIRAEGNARVAMYSMLVSVGMNIILAPLFIFVFHMGVKGAALATVISMMVMCFWVMFHFISKKSTIPLRFENMKLDYTILRSIVSIGMAPFAMQLASSVVQAIFNTQLVRYGDDISVAANGIVMSVSQIIFSSIIGVTMAAQPIIGFNFGAKNFHRVRETLYKAIWIATIISIAGNIIVELFAGPIVMLFNPHDPALFASGVKGIRLAMSTTFVIGFQVVVGNYFQSTGKAKLAIVISLLRQVIVLIPILLLLPPFWGINGVWLSIPIAAVISFMVVTYYFNIERTRLNELVDSREKLL